MLDFMTEAAFGRDDPDLQRRILDAMPGGVVHVRRDGAVLTANAEALRTSTQTIRTQVERGIVDMGALKKANDALIATIDDAVRIAAEGKRQRVEAEKQLAACEAELKQAIVAARSRTAAAASRPS